MSTQTIQTFGYMWGYIGQGLLALSLIFALLQVWGGIWERHISRLLCLTLMSALAVLIFSHVSSNFWLLNVVKHSHTAKPWLYKIAGVWGNHEGSMLLWTMLLSLSSALIRLSQRLYAGFLSITGSIIGAFILFMIISCDPFAVGEIYIREGQDLNPLLQDPALAIHPPILYAGYTLFLIPFALSLLTLINPAHKTDLLSLMRRWGMLAWTLITAGVSLGSFWAYYELGWGGWWFWDPVENSSLMPFLTATAFIHTAKAADKKHGLVRWTLVLAMLTFILCLLGLFLVRSGVLTSVHNFAFDPARGFLLLSIAGMVTCMAVGIFIFKSAQVLEGQPQYSPEIPTCSRQFMIFAFAAIILVGVFSVALGTLYPLLLEAFGYRLSVGAPFFNATVVPMLLPTLILGGISIFVPWLPMPIQKLAPKLLPAFIMSSIGALIVYGYYGMRHSIALMAVFVSFWFLGSSLSLVIKRIQSRRMTLPFIGMTASHVGICIAILGMLGGDGFDEEVIHALAPGESLSFKNGLSLQLEKVTSVKGPNYQADQAHIRFKNQSLRPERRGYWTQGVLHSETAIASAGLAHIYVVLGEPYEGNKWSIRAYYKPTINLLWTGAIFMVLGGLCIVFFLFRQARPFLLILCCLGASMGRAHSVDAHEVLAAPFLEARARQIFSELLCPVCQGQLLAESPLEEARRIRLRIRQDVLSGLSDEDILQKISTEYGEWVRRTPVVNWHTALLWTLPWGIFIMLFMAFGIIWHFSMKSNKKTQN